MHFWAMDVSLAIVNHELGTSKRTIVDWLNFFWEICSQYVAQQNTPIGGPGKTVKIDESVFLLYPDSKLYPSIISFPHPLSFHISTFTPTSTPTSYLKSRSLPFLVS